MFPNVLEDAAGDEKDEAFAFAMRKVSEPNVWQMVHCSSGLWIMCGGSEKMSCRMLARN